MNVKKSVTLTGMAIAIAAGGSSHEANAGIDAGGAPSTKPSVAKGSVTGFGSIYVNGVRYNTDNALFIVDGVIGSESDLMVGQVVSVTGTIDADGANGTADVVTYDDAVEGPISSINAALNRMTVLGQTVLVSEDTAFANADSLSDLSKNVVVEVSGFTDADGNVVATYVGISDAIYDFDVTGTITDVDAAAGTFEINGLDVSYDNANLFDLPGGQPQVGQKVEVLGASTSASSTLIADYVWTSFGIDAGGAPVQAEIEGLVTKRTSLVDFEIDGTPVQVNWGTVYQNGSFFGLSSSRKVEVEGEFDASGVLVADVVKYEQQASVTENGQVDLVVDDMLIVDGAVVTVTPETAYEDNSDADERRFHIDDVQAGDFIEVRGYTAESGEVVATRLERDYASDHDDDGPEDEDDD